MNGFREPLQLIDLDETKRGEPKTPERDPDVRPIRDTHSYITHPSGRAICEGFRMLNGAAA